MGVQGAKTPEALEILHLPKMPKIHPRGPFTLIKISWILLINVMKSSTEVAVANIIASLSITLDKEN